MGIVEGRGYILNDSCLIPQGYVDSYLPSAVDLVDVQLSAVPTASSVAPKPDAHEFPLNTLEATDNI